MSAFDREEARAEMFWRMAEVREMCRKQRVTLLFEREYVQLSREMRHAHARLQLRRAFREEVESVARPLVESVRLN